MAQPSKHWMQEVQETLETQTERAAYLSKFLFKIVPFSVVLGIAAVVIIIQFWGLKEFSRMMLQVVLTLTLGATLFAGVLKRLDKALTEETDEKHSKDL